MNFITFPMKYLTITQTYNGKTSHYPHTSGKPKDYPLDLGGFDSGRDYVYCNCDKLIVSKIYGVGNKGTNTIWLTSADKVIFADGTEDYAVQMFTHPNDDDLKKLKVGQTFTRGQKMFREGSDGASANHIHYSIGKGKLVGTGWTKNSNGKWVLNCTNGAYKPEALLFVDADFTTIKKSNGLTFNPMPKPKTFIAIKKANIREGSSTKYRIVGTIPIGSRVVVTEIFKNSYGNEWGRCSSGYINLAHFREV